MVPALQHRLLRVAASSNKKFRHILESVVSRYRDVEVLRLPEGVFRHAGVGAEVLIAQNLRKSVSDKSETLVRSSEVGRAELRDFEYSLRPTTQVSKLINPAQAPGLIGLMPLRDLWEELSSYPRLGSVASIHRGLEWNYDQANASRSSAAAGYSRGLHRFVDGGLAQFRIGQTTYLDRRPTKLRGGANKYHWDQPKVICSAARTSRGHWRLAAAVDKDGLVVSQQFFGIWLNQTSQGALSHSIKLLSIAAILNSPLSNAFSFCHDSQQRLRVETMKGIPLPRVDTGSKVIYLVDAYLASRDDESVGPLFQQGLRSASSILMEIDALILAAYDLPPRLERELLRFMSVGERPCQHDFPPYPGISKDAGALPLLARLSVNRSERVRAWGVLGTPFSNEVSNVFEII